MEIVVDVRKWVPPRSRAWLAVRLYGRSLPAAGARLRGPVRSSGGQPRVVNLRRTEEHLGLRTSRRLRSRPLAVRCLLPRRPLVPAPGTGKSAPPASSLLRLLHPSAGDCRCRWLVRAHSSVRVVRCWSAGLSEPSGTVALHRRSSLLLQLRGVRASRSCSPAAQQARPRCPEPDVDVGGDYLAADVHDASAAVGGLRSGTCCQCRLMHESP